MRFPLSHLQNSPAANLACCILALYLFESKAGLENRAASTCMGYFKYRFRGTQLSDGLFIHTLMLPCVCLRIQSGTIQTRAASPRPDLFRYRTHPPVLPAWLPIRQKQGRFAPALSSCSQPHFNPGSAHRLLWLRRWRTSPKWKRSPPTRHRLRPLSRPQPNAAHCPRRPMQSPEYPALRSTARVSAKSKSRFWCRLYPCW